LNLFLDHVLDQRWVKLELNVPLLRYIDDLLLPCTCRQHAKFAYHELEKLLHGTGMLLKGDAKSDIRTLTEKCPVNWLGFRIAKTPSGLSITIAEHGWNRLSEKLKNNGTVEGGVDGAVQAVAGWLNHFAPCFSPRRRKRIVERIMPMIEQSVIGHRLPAEDVRDYIKGLFESWQSFRDGLKNTRVDSTCDQNQLKLPSTKGSSHENAPF
jgi:hypothetical protein